MNKLNMDRSSLRELLLVRGVQQEELWKQAKKIRNKLCGNKVYIRGVIEISNFCKCTCKFCGNAAYVHDLKRYRLNLEEIKKQVDYAHGLKLDSIHLASGEDVGFDFEVLKKSIEYIKALGMEPELAIGKLPKERYKELIQLGAKRFILKFETSNSSLFQEVKSCNTDLNYLLEIIDYLIEQGCDVGTGNIIGLPQQDIDDVVDDLLLISEKKLMMVSTSVFIPNSESLYYDKEKGDTNMALNFLALVRCMSCEKNISIPSNSTLGNWGKQIALTYAANELSLNITPIEYKQSYSIYSGKNRRKDDMGEICKIINRNNCSLSTMKEVIYG